MKTNLIFVSLLAVLVMAMGFSSALADDISVEFDGVTLSGSSSIAVSPGEVVPVLVIFTADDNASDVDLEVEIKGSDGASASISDLTLVDGRTYSKLLRLELPDDTDDLNEDFTLYVTVSSSTDEDRVPFNLGVSIQKDSYDLEVLSVDYNSNVDAGETFPVSVVVKNIGYNRADDVYVIASVPALGITTRGYVSDLVVTEGESDYEDEEDSAEEQVYLRIPADAETGIYELVVKAYNDDSSTEVSKLLSVEGKDSTEGDVEVLVGDEDDASGVSTSVVALTVILVVIFVVLLAVLVVLLTKKEKPIEEVETSYY